MSVTKKPKKWARQIHRFEEEGKRRFELQSIPNFTKDINEAQISSSREELIMAKKGKSLRQLMHEFAAQTSAHGVGRVASSESIFWRLLWLLVTLACLGMVIHQGILLIRTYVSKPIKSDVDVTYSRTVNFPAVTVCNLNIVKRSAMKMFPDAKNILGSFENFIEGKDNHSEGAEGAGSSFGPGGERKEAMMKSLKTDSSQAQTGATLINVTVDPEGYVEDRMLNQLAKYTDEELKMAGHPFHELIQRCAWGDFSCKDGDFRKYWKRTWNWRYGNCYTFNSGTSEDGVKIPVLTSSKPGPKYGVILDLFVNQMEYVASLSQEAGVRVLLSDQRRIAFPFSEGFTVSPGFSTSIGMRKLAIFRVDPFNNLSCYSKDEVEHFSIYQGIKGSTYSVQGCMYSCLARAQLEFCNCTEGKFRFGENICDSVSEVKCVLDVIKRYDNDDLGCAAKCPQPCRHYSYRASLSSSTWSAPYEKQMQAVMLKSSDENALHMGRDTDTLRENFVRLKVYFDELNMEQITYSEYYQFENLMSDIGGQLGLWVGVSVITVAEFIKLLLDVVELIFRKMRIQDSKEVDDIKMTK